MTRAPASGRRGFSLPETLLVVALLALVILVSVPLTVTKLRESRLRAAAGEFVVCLRAARTVAVTRGQPVLVTVQSDPTNRYTYVDAAGRARQIELPAGVRIVSSDSPIVFEPSGSVTAISQTVLEASLGGATERWTVQTGLGGIPSVRHERIE